VSTSTPESPSSSTSRPIRIIIAVWLGLISTLAVIDHVALSNLKRDIEARTHNTETERRIAALDQRVDEISHQPASISRTSFTTVQQALEDRLAKVEQNADGSARMNDLALLRDRLGMIEVRLLKVQRPVAPARPIATPTLPPHPPSWIHLSQCWASNCAATNASWLCCQPDRTRLRRFAC